MSCPFSNNADGNTNCFSTNESDSMVRGQNTYGSYLKVEDLLKCQKPLSDVHDEHLFIIVHQVYELWFKQIIKELDSIRSIFINEKVDDRNMLVVVRRLDRIIKIMKILGDQMMILETMTPLEFMEFRAKLAPASGFQSFQFRLLENKFGVQKGNRVRYNNEDYKEIFKGVEKKEEIQKLVFESENQQSLFDLVEKWLERTPGLEVNGFNFWKKFEDAFSLWVKDREDEIKTESNESTQSAMRSELDKLKDTFDTIFNVDRYNEIRARGDRRLTWKALQGALLISFYQQEVLFHQPFQLLTALMDIDSLLTKWRYNHVLLVQRQLGNKVGTGGTSGYQYLRSTVSDRYKVFLDLFNLSNYLIPEKYVPKLDTAARQRMALFTASDVNEE